MKPFARGSYLPAWMLLPLCATWLLVIIGHRGCHGAVVCDGPLGASGRVAEAGGGAGERCLTDNLGGEAGRPRVPECGVIIADPDRDTGDDATGGSTAAAAGETAAAAARMSPPLGSRGSEGPVFYVGSGSTVCWGRRAFSLYPGGRAVLSAAHWLARAANWPACEVLYDPGLHVSLSDTEKFLTDSGPQFYLNSMPLSRDGALDSLALSATLQRIRQRGTFTLILHCRQSLILPLLEKALYFGLIASPYNWVISLKMLPPSHLGAFGLTGVRFWLLELLTSRGPCGAGRVPCGALNTFRALEYDAGSFRQRVASAGACSRNAILNTTTIGLSGPIGFDSDGLRRNGTLVASEMHHDGLQKVGTWSLSEEKGSGTEMKSSKFFFQRATLNILAPEMPGFVSYGQANVSKASGFLVDLLGLIAEKLEFEYQLVPYDRRQMSDVALIDDIRRRLLLHEVDFALFGYPITNKAEDEQLALSPPVFENGYHIIMKGKEVNEPRIFQFLEPLNTLLWISMLSACAGISVVLFVLSLLHPDEWYHLAKRKLVSHEQGQSFNLPNSFWFVFSAMVKQGSDPLPLSMAGKIIVYTWWCFVLVVCSTYTANLAAFLTAEGQTSIRSLKDLTRQVDARYGTCSGYRIVGFLNGSSRDPYATVWRHIRDNRTMVASPKRGLEQAEKAGYIFIGEASAVFTAKKDHCDLIISDRRFFRHRLALPFPPGSRLASDVSRAVAELEDSGQVAETERRWFAQEGQECVGLSNEHQIEMKDFKGVFYFLMMGIAAGCAVCFVECLWFKRRDEVEAAAAAAANALSQGGGGGAAIIIDQLQFQ